jgi:hypothetical protein
MKRISILIMLVLSMAVMAFAITPPKPNAGDNSWNWTTINDSIGVVSTAADTSIVFCSGYYKVFEMVWYMRKIGTLGGDSLQLQIYVEYSMDGTNFRYLDSLDASGATASADSSVWQVKALTTNMALFPYFRVRAVGLTDNDKSGGTSLKWILFLKE